jgi:hypothetical protein
MPQTPNHGYNRPDDGTERWDVPLNANFAALDTDIKLRDTGPPDSGNYDPRAGAAYLDTGTGVVYTADGTSWTAAFVQGLYAAPGDGADAGAIVFGHPLNGTDAGVVGATVAGGGADDGGLGGTVSGAAPNRVTGSYGTVGGGYGNTASGAGATVAGGQNNRALAPAATVGGGGSVTPDTANIAYESFCSVGGGSTNRAGDPSQQGAGAYATVAGGLRNEASGPVATIPGGSRNAARGDNSFAAGNRAKALNDSAFVWNDGSRYHDTTGGSSLDGLSSGAPVAGEPVTGGGTFTVGASRGVRFITGSNEVTYLTDGSAGWSTVSTRAAKTNVEPVSPEQMLAGVESLDVSTWEYADADDAGKGTTHVGPMAEDFHDAFDVGASDEHINSVTADGIAFAAIQGLSARLDAANADLDARDERISALEAETERLHDRLADVEERLATVTD